MTIPERSYKFRGPLFAYISLVAVLLVTIISKSHQYSRAWVVTSLFAPSLPFLVALSLQQGKGRIQRGLAALIGFCSSLIAMAIMLGHISIIAALLFVLVTFFALVAIVTVILLGPGEPKSGF